MTGIQTNASEMRAQVAKLGLAAVLAYGIFDGVTYTSFFVLAFLGYEKSTGLNPAANLKALLGVSYLYVSSCCVSGASELQLLFFFPLLFACCHIAHILRT